MSRIRGCLNCPSSLFCSHCLESPTVELSFNEISKPPSTFVNGGELDTPMLTIIKVDPLITENGGAHNSSRYELMTRAGTDARLVVRRGQEFFIRLYFNRNYDSTIDGISFIFTLDGVKKPQYGRGTFVVVPLLEKILEDENKNAWQVAIHRLDMNSMIIKIIPPANTLIGKWKMEIDAKRKDTDGAISFSLNEPFYILFNPWCPDDDVYVEGEEERQEYVMADTGLIWRGNQYTLRPCVWKYSQFERDILDCALYLLIDVGKIRNQSQSDPVVISRVLSAVVNVQDDNGALVGSWPKDKNYVYTDGKSPTQWIGSQKILQQYFKTKKPVKYAQCWVYAGVLATICRTLGLPCRVVTNYESAHDAESSLTIDYFYDADAKNIPDLSEDAVWNFHVWNEVWMKRNDLGSDYDGWQVIDATPQELSGDSFRCGPTSVAAVKKGEVSRPYDGGFVYAEVNADRIIWRYNGPTQPLKLIGKDKREIGKYISTKAVGSWTREDITDSYKYPQSSKEDRESMINALRQSKSSFSRYYLNDEFNDIMFNFELRDDITIGEPFDVILLVKNRNKNTAHEISVLLRVEVVTYTGRVGSAVKRLNVDRLIKPGALEEIRLNVSYDEYGPRLLSQCAFNITCLATVKDTNFEYFAQDDFRVQTPNINIERKSEAIVGEVLHVTASFVNPLPVALRKGKFLIEGPGLTEQIKIKLTENIQPGDLAKCQFSMIPKKSGRSTIAAKFYSKELDDVDGFVNFMVKPEMTNEISYN